MNESKPKISESHKIVSNTIFSTLSELSLLFTSVFYILAARFLGDVDFGKLSTATGFVGVFTLVVIFGFSYSITKIIVRERDRAGVYVNNALFIQIIFALLSFIICMLTASVVGYPPLVKQVIVLVFFAETLKCLSLTLRASCKALGSFHYDTIAVNSERLFLMIVGAAVLILGKGLLAVALVLVVARMISFALLMIFFLRLDVTLLGRPQWSVCKELLKKSWIYVVQSVFWRIYNHIDVVMISMMRTFSEVGWYSAGRRIIEGLWFIPNIITEAVYPELSARHLVSRRLVVKLFEKSFKYVLTVAVMITIGSLLVAKPLILLIYDVAYEKTILVFVLLSVSIVPSYLCYIFGNTLIAVNLQVKETYVSISRSIFNILSNLLLIPLYGFIGATIATVATDYFTVAGYLIILKKAGIVNRSQLRFAYKPLLAGVLLVPVYFVISGIHLFFQLSILLILYVVLVLLFKIFSDEEIDVFRNYLVEKSRRLAGLIGKKK